MAPENRPTGSKNNLKNTLLVWVAASSGAFTQAGKMLAFSVFVLNFLTGPALAQPATTSLCDAEPLIEMVEGFFRLTTSLGVIGLPVMWQASYLIELLNPTPEQRQRLESFRRSALKSAIILMLLGPLYTVAGSMLGFPLAPCIDLIPTFGGG